VLLWPVENVGDIRPFGFEPGGRHTGVDVYADEGVEVYSPVSGSVVWSGHTSAGFGIMAAVASSGRVIILGHLAAVVEGLDCGDGVTAGEMVGYVGCTGACTRPHIHIEVRHRGFSWNPELWLP
jgi:murein DD-endopeptidase MepM/ murein hydrolase activator NlpD